METLSNGLRILYRQSPGVPLAAASLLLRTGSVYESSKEAGLANLTTELLLQGTRRRTARRIADVIESMGASIGTQALEDHSEMGFVAPANHVDQVFDVLVDTLVDPRFPPEEIQKERATILADLKSRNDTIFNCAYDAFAAALFGSHPYGRPIDGTLSTVPRFTRERLQAWHQRHLRPDRAIFSWISPLPPKQASAMVERHFKKWKRPASAFREQAVSEMTFPRKNTRIKLKRPFEQAFLMTGVPAPSAFDSAHIPLKVLNTLLGGGMSSRLFLILREKSGLAYDVSSFYPTHFLTSQWGFYLGLPAAKLTRAEALMEEILEDLKIHGPRPEEVRQAIHMIKGAYLMEHQTRRRQAWYAAWWELMGKEPDYDQQFLKQVEAVTPEELRDLAKRLLSQPRVTVEVTP